MMDIFDDLRLAPLIRVRLKEADEHPQEIIETSIAQLERAAKAKVKASTPAQRRFPKGRAGR